MWMTVCAISTFGSYDAALMNVFSKWIDEMPLIAVASLTLSRRAHEQQARQRLQLRIGAGGERHRSVGGTARIAAIREFSIGVFVARPASRSCIICGNPRE